MSPYLQQKRLKAALPWLKGKILDYGCGNSKLAAYCEPEAYLGIDRDEKSLEIASNKFPHHHFTSSLPESHTGFNTITMLAILEHFSDPVSEVNRLLGFLLPGGQIVLTTPHPRGGGIYTIGSLLGIFSRSAHDEHNKLFTRKDLLKMAKSLNLQFQHYSKFLFGYNQLCILKKE